ncbi:SET domain-containing protein [Colletotrichum sojae]|uniref:SET domain-containing protein n=1 Tax=Colletotrichum sojae TaxID=2175907 RepID=A0A8H6JDT5_9PEZI|nr:SET domain-containing protein [Colletotrichum sojae]
MASSQLPLETLSTWAMFNDVDLVDVEAHEIPGCGLGLISNKALSREEETFDIPTLLRIPHELVLSAEAVENYAKVDRNFRELLDAAGHKTPTKGGVSTPWTEYVKYLPPQVPVTSLWTEPEREMLNGTSLEASTSSLPRTIRPRRHAAAATAMLRDLVQTSKLLARDWPGSVPPGCMPNHCTRMTAVGQPTGTERPRSATAAKIVALTDEFDELRETSAALPFWNELFWESDKVSLIDWARVDAWFRSRCLELPKSGEVMVPVLDLANHSSKANAYYEENGKDEVVLLLRPSCRVESGEEMTISYGDAKSGAEMLFSYGFIDPASAADRLTLPLAPMDDDPLGKAKAHIFDGAPNVEFDRTNGTVHWKSPFAYFMCLNEEDGLSFRVLQDHGGSRELKVFWQEEDVTATTTAFEQHINGHPLAQIFRLRVVTVLEDLVSSQLERLATGMSLEDLDASLSQGGLICGACINAAATLREQETSLLEAAVKALEAQVSLPFLSRLHSFWTSPASRPPSPSPTALPPPRVRAKANRDGRCAPTLQKTQLLADENVVAYLGSMEEAQNDLAVGETSNDEEDFS